MVPVTSGGESKYASGVRRSKEEESVGGWNGGGRTKETTCSSTMVDPATGRRWEVLMLNLACERWVCRWVSKSL